MKRTLVLALTAFLMAACSAPVVRGTRDNSAVGESDAAISVIRPGEAIVVLSADTSLDDHKWPSSCVRGAIEGADTNIRIIAAKDFREALYPWLEGGVSAEVITELMEKPLTRNRIEEMGVRYIVAVGGETGSERDDAYEGPEQERWEQGYVGKHGAMTCGAGYGYGGCLGLLAWKRTSDLSAVVWDLKSGIRAGTIDVEVSGTNVMPAFFLPIPIIAPTETAACSEIGDHLARFITTGEMPAKPAVGVPADESSSK
jgi:hypothetical protein